MAYSTVANIRTQTPFKSDLLIEDTYIEQKIAEADSIIDTYLIKVYTLPLASIPNIVENISKQIASLLLYQEQNPNFEVEPGISIEDAWQRQMEILNGIANRSIILVDDNGAELATNTRLKPSFYPNASSSLTTATNSTAPKITMNEQF